MRVESSVTPIGLVWFAALFVTNGVGILYFWYGTSAADKRQFFPWFSALTAVLFLGLLYFGVQAPLPLVAVVGVFVGVGAAVHVQFTTFCPRCARMIIRGVLSARVDFCPRCGLPLDRTPSGDL